MAQGSSITSIDGAAAVLAAKAEGAPVVGIVGAGVPIELVLASGAIPVRLIADPLEATPRADALIGAGEGAAMRALVERALDGSWAAVDLLVITRQHEWLYYYLKEAVRAGEATVPPLHMHDFIPSAEPSLRAYNRERLQRLAEALERVTGKAIGMEDIDRAVAAANRRRDALRRIQSRRDVGAISGTDAIRLIAASHMVPVDRFVADVHDRLGRLDPPSGPRLLLLASQPDEDASLHQAIEAGIVVVVAEDSEWGTRSDRPDLVLGEHPYDALLDDLLAGASGPDVSPRAARLAWAEAALARDDIVGVIFAIPGHDSKFGWDYPSLRDRATALGLPALLLRDDHRAAPAAVTSAVAAFAADLNRGLAA